MSRVDKAKKTMKENGIELDVGLMAREGRAVEEHSGDGTITFLVDSGASSHFVRPGTLLHDVVPYQGCVMIASGGTISLNKNRQASL